MAHAVDDESILDFQIKITRGMDDYVPDLVPSPDQKLIPGPIGRSKKGTLENNIKIFGLKKVDGQAAIIY